MDERSNVDDLKERVKELNCFYGISALLNDPKLTMVEIMERMVNLLPPAFQYPEIACARVRVKGLDFKTDGYMSSKWRLESQIMANGQKVGSLEVCYRDEMPEVGEGSFFLEERRLLNAIAELIGKFIEQSEIKEELDKQTRMKAMDEAGYLKVKGAFGLAHEMAEWEIILELLTKTDPGTLLRITRKMMYHLYRVHNEEVDRLMNTLCPESADPSVPQWCGINMPNPRQDIAKLKTVQSGIFDIARRSLPPEEISALFHRWLREDKARSLLLASQRRNIPLVQITDELNRFWENPNANEILAPEDDIAIRAALIRRFFTSRLEYINIAKRFLEVEDFVDILKYVVGPAQGEGKFGGKVSGILLAEKIIRKAMEGDPALEGISFAKSWYLTSDTMLDLIHYNDLDEVVHIKYLDPSEIRQDQPFLEQVFKNVAFTAEIVEGLRRVLRDLKDSPIIVRSSSLLEDSFGAAFSGKYKSLFIANVGTEEERLNALMDAITEVYASTFGPDPIEYRRERGLLDFNEEMAVLIQQVVGQRIGPYFLPAYAGVAFSNNEFSWSPRIRRTDGIIRLVAGLGTRAVDRVGNDYPILVSPHKPEIRVNTLVEERVRYSQRYLDVINLEKGIIETVTAEHLLNEYGDQYPGLSKIVSVYRDGTLMAPTSLLNVGGGELVVTFENLIERSQFIPTMRKIVTLLKETCKMPVDIEFASDGKKLYILQCRPQSQSMAVERVPVPTNVPGDMKLFSASRYITTSHIEGIEYIVYVDPDAYESLERRDDMLGVARSIGDINNSLPRRKFVFIGPGRWGSRGDIKLGVPVIYRDINNTSLLIEMAREKGGYLPDLSFGTHFFQDLVEADIHYLPLYPDDPDNVFNWHLLDIAPNRLGEMFPKLKHLEGVIKLVKVGDISSGGTMSVVMDGEAGEALAYMVPPDHWVWRLNKVEELAAGLDADVYGVAGLYVFGSTKEATAGPASDIDLLVHFRGTSEQRERLMVWLQDWNEVLERENRERTGVDIPNILDIHIITDEDIEKKSSWATHIDSPYNPAKKVPLGKGIKKR